MISQARKAWRKNGNAHREMMYKCATDCMYFVLMVLVLLAIYACICIPVIYFGGLEPFNVTSVESWNEHNMESILLEGLAPIDSKKRFKMPI